MNNQHLPSRDTLFSMPDFMMPHYCDLADSLFQEATVLQPEEPSYISRATAIHEAAHCVAGAREDFSVTAARIFKTDDGNWSGNTEFELKRPQSNDQYSRLSHMRCALAGRRGELLFMGDAFCMRAGVYELAYAMTVNAVLQSVGNAPQPYEVFGTMLAELDETLLAHRKVVREIADQLMSKGTLRSRKLAKLLSAVQPYSETPQIRGLHELDDIVRDPLVTRERVDQVRIHVPAD